MSLCHLCDQPRATRLGVLQVSRRSACEARSVPLGAAWEAPEKGRLNLGGPWMPLGGAWPSALRCQNIKVARSSNVVPEKDGSLNFVRNGESADAPACTPR